jgi:DNA helicase-2/ATP-dependent DNA helicase PcrA
MRFHADLHIHSKHSRATSRDLDLEHLACWAGRKGVGLVATGDFTHPAWRAELKDKLLPAEPGLFRLRSDIEADVAQRLPPACRTPVRFMLEVEISTIYKKNERTRKIHHLIYAPDFATVDRISERLARIGNIESDGRPILGLDSRDLLEIVLESHPGAYLVPAHIWTPWFAALGSMSGFDSIEECYCDLAKHIFAVETGLSSDPPMNWRLSMLDRYRLTSNSDAHSPGKIGREATAFDCDLDYFAVRRALETGRGYVGTVEFFPEEGKYHLDGHRKCHARLTPEQTRAHGGRCPVCGEPVTVGVMHRVEALADRGEAEARPPASAGEVANLVALPEILSEIAQSGAGSLAVAHRYERTIAALGPELSILEEVPTEDIAKRESPLLAEAIARLRAGNVTREAGYDGEYGTIRLFEQGEIKRLSAVSMLFEAPTGRIAKSVSVQTEPSGRAPRDHVSPAETLPVPKFPLRALADRDDVLSGLDEQQRAAVETIDGTLLIVAGPGSGKTRTLTHRIAHLVESGVPAKQCLAITFTRRAAAEMRERLARLVPAAATVPVHTFHSLGLTILREHANAAGLQPDFRVADESERAALLVELLSVTERRAEALLRSISRAKRTSRAPNDEVRDALLAYDRALSARGWIDFDDLVLIALRTLEANPDIAGVYRDRHRYLSVDEFQDVDEQQYRLLRLVSPPGGNLCVIGDPDQAIYSFRGADAACFDRFRADYPDARIVRLARNYRSSGTIVSASSQVIAGGEERPLLGIVRDMHERIAIHAAATERAEAEFVVKTIEEMLGGHSFFSIDSGRAGAGRGGHSFSDFAILHRAEAQAEPLIDALARAGIPFRKSRRASAEHEIGAEQEFDPRGERVALMTLHAAKGLEFPVVFIVGLEDGILPLHWGDPDEAALAEERRLFYVGMTRAKDRLVLSRALSRRRHGRVQRQEASPFLGDIVEELVKHQRADYRRKPEDRQLKLL